MGAYKGRGWWRSGIVWLLAGVGALTACTGPGQGHPKPSASHRRTVAVGKGTVGTRVKANTASLPPMAAPSSTRPLTILVIGDSLGEDLGYGLRDLLGGRPDVRLVLAAVGSTGLVNVAYYNWAAHLAEELAALHPGLVVALFGGNDALSFDADGQYVPFGSDRWSEVYGARVATLMHEATASGARVLWVGLPVMSPTSVLNNRAMASLNAVYAAEAEDHPGVAFVSTWTLFQAPGGGYTADLRDSEGVLREVRDPDGVHIAPPYGNDLVATAVIAAIARQDGLLLCPSRSDAWRDLLPPGCAGPAPAVGPAAGGR